MNEREERTRRLAARLQAALASRRSGQPAAEAQPTAAEKEDQPVAVTPAVSEPGLPNQTAETLDSVVDMLTYYKYLAGIEAELNKSWGFGEKLVEIQQKLNELQLKSIEIFGDADEYVEELIVDIVRHRTLLYELDREVQSRRLEKERRDRELSRRMEAIENMPPEEQIEVMERQYRAMINALGGGDIGEE